MIGACASKRVRCGDISARRIRAMGWGECAPNLPFEVLAAAIVTPCLCRFLSPILRRFLIWNQCEQFVCVSSPARSAFLDEGCAFD